ncbi:MAG: hypothetical protein ACE5GL_08740, partial [Calditrichia bacterium]
MTYFHHLITVLNFIFLFLLPNIAHPQITTENKATAGIPLPSSGSWPGNSSAFDTAVENISDKIDDFQSGVPFPLTPTVSNTIEGINFDEDASNSGFYHIPPDPNGAAGPGHLISVVNTSIEWHTKAGVQQNSESLKSFFTSQSPLTGTFDPKVIYDQYSGRFVVLTVEKVETGTNPDPGNVSRIYIAVSDDSDPNGTWYYHTIDAKTTIGGVDHWADYPGFAVDEEALYITANMFAHSGAATVYGVRLWIIDKGPGSGGFYDGGTASVTVHDPYAGAGIETTTQPAHIFGSPPSGSTGTFLVSYSGLTGGGIEYVQVVRVDNPLSSPAFTQQYVSVGDIEGPSFPALPGAPQSGTASTVDVNDRRALNAVWRNNSLYMTATVYPNSGPDANQTTAHWWKLNTSNPASITLADQGDVGGEDIAAGAYTFFPSVMVDAEENMAIGFSASASTIYPGAYYTGRLAGDVAGTVRESSALRTGLDYYKRTFGGSRNRWGDYSSISLDPSDSLTFWVFNQYALPRGTVFGGEDGRWGTSFGSFDFKARATLKVFLEGPYSTSGDSMSTAIDSLLPLSQPFSGSPWNYKGTESVTSLPANVTDWVLVELRSDTSASSTVDSVAAFLKKDGTVVDTSGSNPLRFKVNLGDY